MMEAIDAHVFSALRGSSGRRCGWRWKVTGRMGGARRRRAGDAGGGAGVAVAGVRAAEAAPVAVARSGRLSLRPP